MFLRYRVASLVKRSRVIAAVVVMCLSAIAVYFWRFHDPITEQERATIALDVYEAVVHYAHDPVVNYSHQYRDAAITVNSRAPPAELLQRFDPSYQAVPRSGFRDRSTITYALRDFVLLN